MRVRRYPASNYHAVFFDGKTVRIKLDPNRPILATPTPEIEDVAINDKCYAACSYCYTSALKSGNNFNNIVDKANEVWGNLEKSDRPFQIAVGGAGESTLHPDWAEFMTAVNFLGITPNYTTNGMHLNDEILGVTESICGGVALSWHPHIPKVFERAVSALSELDTKFNVHVIVGDEQSLGDLKRLYRKYSEVFDYFVVLPYMAAGRAKEIETHNTWKNTFDWISQVNSKQFAFGALFYDWFEKNEIGFELSLYEPEIFSGYRILDDRYDKLFKSSYNLTLK